jgi:hypothetical protein
VPSPLDKIPFSVYDFFAYLSSGAMWVLTADYILGTGLLGQKEITAVLGVALVVFAYVCGHIVAHFSSFIMEHLVVARLLKRPATLLMGGTPRLRIFKWVFPNYFRPLPEHTQRRVTEQAESRGLRATGEALFLHAYPIVSSNGGVQARLDDFRNQYGFARNMSFAFLTSGIAILLARYLGYGPVRLRWALLATLAGIALFYRYLKFFRQYSYELFLRYAELERPNSK